MRVAVDRGAHGYEVGHQLARIAFNAADPANPVIRLPKMSMTCS